MQNENRFRELSDSICSNICIIRVPEEERQKGAENLFEEIIAENFPHLGKETDTRSRRHRELHQNQQKQILTKTYCNQIGKIQ